MDKIEYSTGMNDEFHEPVTDKERKSGKVQLIGFGTFMTHTLSNYEGKGNDKTWNIPVKIIKPVRVKNHRRFMAKMEYPLVIPQKGHEFMGLLFEVTLESLTALDKVEDDPHGYYRRNVYVDGNKYYIYIPCKKTLESEIGVNKTPEGKDKWHKTVVDSMNKLAKEKFPEVLNWKIS